MTEDSNKTPSTVRELGIEFQGFRALVDLKFENLTQSIIDLTEQLKESNSNKADKKDVDDLRHDFESYLKTHEETHEELLKQVYKKPVLAIVLSSTFSVIFTAVVLYVVNDLLNGGK